MPSLDSILTITQNTKAMDNEITVRAVAPRMGEHIESSNRYPDRAITPRGNREIHTTYKTRDRSCEIPSTLIIIQKKKGSQHLKIQIYRAQNVSVATQQYCTTMSQPKSVDNTWYFKREKGRALADAVFKKKKGSWADLTIWEEKQKEKRRERRRRPKLQKVKVNPLLLSAGTDRAEKSKTKKSQTDNEEGKKDQKKQKAPLKLRTQKKTQATP